MRLMLDILGTMRQLYPAQFQWGPKWGAQHVFDLDMGAVNLLNPESCKRYQSVPIGFADGGALLLAMADPTNVLTIDDVAMMTGRRVRPVAASDTV